MINSLVTITLPDQIRSPMPLESEPATISGILLSDLSIVEQNTQKRSVIGIFEKLGFPQFPASYGTFCITVWLTNIEGTLSELEVTSRIELAGSAHVIFSSAVKLAFPERRFERDGVLGLTIPAVNVAFPNPGTYTVKILLNGEDAGKRDFSVVQIPQPT